MFVIVVMTMMVASSLSYSLSTYRQAMRNQLLEQAKVKAEGEMEVLYFNWKNEVFNVIPPERLTAELLSDNVIVPEADFETQTVTPFINESRGAWSASRSLRYGTTQIGVSDNKTGQVSDFTALTRVTVVDPVLGSVEYRMGRRFAITNTALFQFSVFYQDVMEFSAGSAMTIRGDISGNGAIFMGSQAAGTLKVVDKINFFTSFNGDANPLNGTTMRAVAGGSSLHTPIFDPTPADAAPDQVAARGSQVTKMSEKENFLGGIDINGAMDRFGPLRTKADGTTVGTATPAYATENDVYRSVISPPPRSGGTVVDEDPVIRSNRMYTKAGLVIEVRNPSDVNVAEGRYPVKIFSGNRTVDLAASYPTLVAAVTPRQPVFDVREGTNVYTTSLDVGALGTAIKTLSGNNTVRNNYNGVVYIHDPTAPADSGDADTVVDRNAVRLVNGARTPFIAKSDGNPLGFTVATDNGLYIKGNYNTVRDSDAVAAGKDNLAAVLGDAVTVLSDAWDDARAASSVTTRIATDTSIVAAILSGNTPTDLSGSTSVNSGGVQNLVRLAEDWQGRTLSLKGSLGQLFTSKYFTGAIKGTGAVNNLYFAPLVRNLTFDAALAATPPTGAPTTTTFRRGSYFVWFKGQDPSRL